MTRVSLREVEDEDLFVFYEYQRDPEAIAMAAFPARDKDAHLAHWTRILTDDTVIVRTVVVDGDVVGNVLSFVKNGRRAVGYWIGRPHWGRGIATEALKQFVDLVTERPLVAFVAVQNPGSIRVLEKCGFEPTQGDTGMRVVDGIEELVLELRAGSTHQ